MPMRRCSGSTQAPSPGDGRPPIAIAPASGRLEAGDHPQQRRLARAAGAEQRDELARRSTAQRRAVDRAGAAEALLDTVGVDAPGRHEADKVTLTMASAGPAKRLGRRSPRGVLVIALLAVAAFALGGSADVVVYNGRSQYGDEQAFKAFEEQTGPGGRAARRHRARAVRAPAPRGRRDARRPAGHDRPREPLARRRRPACSSPSTTPALERRSPSALRDPDGAWWGMSTRIRTPMRSTERVPGGRRHELRGPRRPALPRPPLPAHVEQRVQPVASSPTGSPSAARPRPSSCCAPGWPTSRASSAPTSTCSTRSPPAAATSA